MPKIDRGKITEGVQRFIMKERAIRKVKAAGLPSPPAPEEKVEGVTIFTEWESVKNRYGGISQIPFNILGEYLDRWTGLVSYARLQEALADIDFTTSKEIRDTIKKQLYLVQEGSRELRDASVYAEDLYIEWEGHYLNTYTRYELTKSLREGYEQIANAISREITRRGNDVVDTRRGVNRGGLA